MTAAFPATLTELYRWNAALFAAYCVTAFLLDQLYRRSTTPPRSTGMRAADYLFNGATFSASVLLGIGIIKPEVLRLIGDTTSYLTLAAFAGLGYVLIALAPKDIA